MIALVPTRSNGAASIASDRVNMSFFTSIWDMHEMYILGVDSFVSMVMDDVSVDHAFMAVENN